MQFTIIPSHYNATASELVELGNHLAMSPQIIQSPFRRKKFSIRAFFFPPPVTEREAVEVRIHPHGHTPEQRLHSLMFFFHCLGLSKRNLPE